MLKLGITGGIGSGKSVVSELFKLIGIPVYIADIESRRLTDTSPIIRQKLIAEFGSSLYNGDILNRSLLASYVFSDKSKLTKLNAIIHPELETHFNNWLEQNKGYNVVAKEAAIMYESGLDRLMDKVIMVYAPREVRISRAVLRDNCSREKVIARINNQMDDDEKKLLSDYIIYNDGSMSLIQQTSTILQRIGYTF